MILGLRSEIHPAPDLAATRQWFIDALGVQPYFDEEFYVGFNVGGYELGLDPNRRAASGAQSYWGVDDLDQALADLVGSGAVAEGEIQDVGDGIRMITLSLPDGAGTLGLIQNPTFAALAVSSPGPGQ